MSTLKYVVAQIEADGIRCKFESMGGLRDGWIMPDGVGVDYAGYAQLTFEPQAITTENVEALNRSRSAVANYAYALANVDEGLAYHGESDWEVDGDKWRRLICIGHGDTLRQLEFQMRFAKNSAASGIPRTFDLTHALAEDVSWEPVYSPWRHGGWYVSNVQHINGGCGCVSNNYPDKKWRIVCDNRREQLGDASDFTYRTRDAAARAERQLVRDHAKQRLAPPVLAIDLGQLTTARYMQPSLF